MKTFINVLFLLLISHSVSAETEVITSAASPQTRELFQRPSLVEQKAQVSPLEPALRQQATTQAYQSTAWFQSIDLTLRYDLNQNGFFSQLYIRFDANTDFSSQLVYAKYSLIDSNRHERLIHTSSVFTLYRQSRDDWFAIETDLAQLPTGYYKLLIELIDANTGYVLAEISGFDNATLDRLALEDISRDKYVAVVVREEYGGVFGIFYFFALSSIYVLRRKLKMWRSLKMRF